jgi:hypothetical protein
MATRKTHNRKPLVLYSLLGLSILLTASVLLAVFLLVRGDTSVEEPTSNQEILEKLKALPYVSYVEEDLDPSRKKVTILDEETAYPGLNLYIPSAVRRAFLVDMKGEILHQWKPSEDMVGGHWLYSEIDVGGNLFLLVRRVGLFKMNKDSSRAEAIVKGKFHHDFDIDDNGDIFILSRQQIKVPVSMENTFITDDYINHVSPGGRLRKRISLWDLFGKTVSKKTLETIKRKEKTIEGRKNKKVIYDLFHSNTIEIIRKNNSIASKGDLLICMRNLDLIAVVDPETERVLWSWGRGVLDKPHHPTFLENGNILVFDNGMDREYSRILEYDPVRGEIVWKYQADPPADFFSRARGSNQRLPNGNTLITETTKGRVFEVTREGRIVWEFYSPHFGKKNKKRKTIYRMTRVEKEIMEKLE